MPCLLDAIATRSTNQSINQRPLRVSALITSLFATGGHRDFGPSRPLDRAVNRRYDVDRRSVRTRVVGLQLSYCAVTPLARAPLKTGSGEIPTNRRTR